MSVEPLRVSARRVSEDSARVAQWSENLRRRSQAEISNDSESEQAAWKNPDDPQLPGRMSLVRAPLVVPKKKMSRKKQIKLMLTQSAWYTSPLSDQIRGILYGKIFATTMCISLLLALFLHDLWILWGINSDAECDVLLTVVMILFAAELFLLSAVDSSYFLSFFCFMDVIGTLSMVADISYMLGPKTMEATSASDASDHKNYMLLRATRAARVGARLGRLSRVVRLIRFLPFLTNAFMRKNYSKTTVEEKRCAVTSISSQVANIISTRVACLTIILVTVIPIFDVLTFPQNDNALQAWVERLSEDLKDGDIVAFKTEANEMAEFFSSHSYGPYRACQGYGAEDGSSFECTSLRAGWGPKFDAPPRAASGLFVQTRTFLVAFNMHQPIQVEAGMAIINILFIVVIMIFSGMSLSSVVNELAVRPLERMLGTVKQIATTVFKFSAEVVRSTEGEMKKEDIIENEMKLLEKVVAKLAIIADLQTRDKHVDMHDMRHEDIGILNMMQGKNIVEEAKKHEDRRATISSKKSTISKMSVGRPTMNIEDTGVTEELFDSWELNALTLTREQKMTLCSYVILQFRENSLQDYWSEFMKTSEEHGCLARFVTACEREYIDAPFHSFSHATDVTHAVSRMLHLIGSDLFLNELEQYCLLISAIGHDLGHPGVNNGFLSEVSHELALRYNDRSPLENMHCSKLFAIIVNKETNVFASLTREQYKDIRKMCVETILHTDMMGHMGMVKDLQMVFQMNAEVLRPAVGSYSAMGPCYYDVESEIEIFRQPEMKMLTMDCLLHSADVSNPARIWEVASAWAARVLEEFFSQGDEEKRLQIPVQFLNDRDKLNRPNSQIGFIEFMIAPFFAAQIRLWPALSELGDNLGDNIGNWEKLWIAETKPPEEDAAKVHERCCRVQNSFEEAATRGAKPPA